MYPPLAGRGAGRLLRGPAAGRSRRRQLPDRPFRRLSRAGQRRGDPLHRPDRLAGDRRARRQAPRRRRGRARRPGAARARVARAPTGPLVAANGRPPGGTDSSGWDAMTQLLGHRRGHLRRQGGALRRRSAADRRGAAREGARAPAPGLGGAGPGGGPERRRRGDRRGAAGRGRRGRSWGSTTRASPCSPGTPRAAVPLTPIVTWQDKRSQEVLDRLEADGRADEVRERSGMPLDPYFSAGKLAWLLEHDEAVGRARDAGTLRLGTVDSFLCDRLGAGFATDPATASRTQLGRSRVRPGAARDLRRAEPRRCRRSRTRPATSACSATTRGRSSCRCGRAAPTSRRRSPGPAASSPGWRRRPTAPASSSSPTPATSARGRAAACCRRSPGGSGAASSGRSTAASSPPGPCWSG